MSQYDERTTAKTHETRGGAKMKTKRTTFRSLGAGLLLAIGLGVAGCTDDFTDINTNPNAPTDVGGQYLLPAGIVDAVSDLLGTGWDRGTASVWVQHYARLQYGDVDRYEISGSFSDSWWSGLYTGALVDFDGMVQKASATGNVNQQAVGIIMRSWMFHNMVDMWGDIPYSQALGGLASGNITPAYDDASSIYSGLLSELTGASTMIAPTGSLFGDAFRGTVGNPDLIHGGDMEKWRLFANSLRLRMAMRIGSASDASSAIAAGVIQSAAEETKLNWLGVAPNENPMAQAFIERPGDYRISKTMIDNLVAYNDPRLSVYADASLANGDYVGMPNGVNDSHGIEFEEVSRIGTWFLQRGTPTWIISYAEVALLQAEAAARGFAGGDAQSLYEAGIRASMQTYGISSADIDAYIASPMVAFAADTNTRLDQIAMQMWFLLYDQGPEAWAYQRRTGVPVLIAGPDNVNNDRVPVRLPYPLSEHSVNNTNLQAANSAQGLSSEPWNVRLFWDAN